jgi:hypothetical protein
MRKRTKEKIIEKRKIRKRKEERDEKEKKKEIIEKRKIRKR